MVLTSSRCFIRRIFGLPHSLRHTCLPSIAAEKGLPSSLYQTTKQSSVTTNHRSLSTDIEAIENEQKEIRVIERKKYISEVARKKNMTFLARIKHLCVPPPEKVMSPKEVRAREELIADLESYYYRKPPEEPGAEFASKVLDFLIKSDDIIAVEVLWTHFVAEKGVKLDEALSERVEEYLLTRLKKAWHEDPGMA